MSEKTAVETAQNEGLPIGEGVNFLLWVDELDMFVHVERGDVEKIIAKRPDYEISQNVFGRFVSSLCFIQSKRGAA